VIYVLRRHRSKDQVISGSSITRTTQEDRRILRGSNLLSGIAPKPKEDNSRKGVQRVEIDQAAIIRQEVYLLPLGCDPR
jgi:hypothetical protein